MDKVYEYTKTAIVNFKLERCCCLAPIRIGVIIIAYFNVFVALVSLVGTADGGITPPLMAVQEAILEDNASKPLGVIAYAAELGSNMVLLCGMYRNDIILLRVYTYFVMVAVVTSVLVYSMVIGLISLLTKLLIFASIVFECYLILLVRSAIVEIKEERRLEKNGQAVLYTVTVTDQERKEEVKLPEIQQSLEKSELAEKSKPVEVQKPDDTENKQMNEEKGSEEKANDK